MKIEKIHLDNITRCYCASHMDVDNETIALFASEDPSSVCNSYSLKDFKKIDTLWDDAGGCMSIIPFKNRKNEFLAVQEFYLKVSPSLSKIVWGKYNEGKWDIKEVLSLPYLHRFDIYSVGDVDYFIAATIAESKENKEDWSKPGQIYVGIIPDNPTSGITLTKIVDGCFKNHGYYRGVHNDEVCGYFASEQGVLRVCPPTSTNQEWNIEKIMEGSISEIAFVDIDNDGKEKMMTIEPFHGNTIKVYKEINGQYKCVYTYSKEIDFAHALVGGKVNNINSFIAGVRRVNCELFILQYENNEFKEIIIEENVGPANIDLINTQECDYILSANHTKNEAAVYIVRK